MARLYEDSDSGEEFPDLSTIMCPTTIDQRKSSPSNEGKSKTIDNALEKEIKVTRSPKKGISELQEGKKSSSYDTKSVDKASFAEKQFRKQKPLGLAHVNSLLLPLSNVSLQTPEKLRKPVTRVEDEGLEKASPRRRAQRNVELKSIIPDLRDIVHSTEDEGSYDDLSGFIVYGSSSDSEAKPPRSTNKDRRRSPKKTYPGHEVHLPLGTSIKQNFSEPEVNSAVIDLTSPAKNLPSTSSTRLENQSNAASTKTPELEDPYAEDPCANLRFSPPRSRSPHKRTEAVRFVTPPPSPSKPKLQSPSKRDRIPPSPHRPSINAFWSQEVINDWNDQYSPKKTPRSKRLFPLDEENENDISPSSSPLKSPIKAPAKKDKLVIERKKVFNERKHDLAVSFLKELDETIAKGQVSSLAASTGGIQIIWSKKLNSTAGRANWKREAIRSKAGEGITITTTTYRHHASIELAEKVIDDEDRLLNVLAHEYCHLTNFMLSNVKTAPHGPSFKSWARLVTTAFAHRNVLVTTKHTYAIAYKYIWACSACGIEFKRHSKSIDPARHTCGSCKGRLVQVQPVPRKAAGGGWEEFVRENFGRVKGELGEGGLGEVMGVLGREWKESKGKGEGERVEVVEVGSEGEDGEKDDMEIGVEDVARKLDFLSLSLSLEV